MHAPGMLHAVMPQFLQIWHGCHCHCQTFLSIRQQAENTMDWPESATYRPSMGICINAAHILTLDTSKCSKSLTVFSMANSRQVHYGSIHDVEYASFLPSVFANTGGHRVQTRLVCMQHGGGNASTSINTIQSKAGHNRCKQHYVHCQAHKAPKYCQGELFVRHAQMDKMILALVEALGRSHALHF